MAGREPSASPLPLPPAYGKPTRPMAWSDADDLLTESRVYWIASVRPDGRPHIVPSDGIWLDDALYFGGSPDTVHMRNVRATGLAVAHVGDGLAAAVIVEGNVTDETPTPDVAVGGDGERLLGGLLGEVEVAEEADQCGENAAPFLAEDLVERCYQYVSEGRISTAPP